MLLERREAELDERGRFDVGDYRKPCAAARTEVAALTAERDELFGMTLLAPDVQKTVLEVAALEIRLKLFLYVLRQRPADRLARGEECRIVLLDELVEERLLGQMLRVTRRIDGASSRLASCRSAR